MYRCAGCTFASCTGKSFGICKACFVARVELQRAAGAIQVCPGHSEETRVSCRECGTACMPYDDEPDYRFTALFDALGCARPASTVSPSCPLRCITSSNAPSALRLSAFHTKLKPRKTALRTSRLSAQSASELATILVEALWL